MFQFELSPTDASTPYVKQGDDTFYTKAALKVRSQLRQDQQIIQVIDQFWHTHKRRRIKSQEGSRDVIQYKQYQVSFQFRSLVHQVAEGDNQPSTGPFNPHNHRMSI